MKSTVETPWQVRYVRWWWIREARRHLDVVLRRRRCTCTGGGWPCSYEKWHRQAATTALGYAKNCRPHWLATGTVPFVMWSEGEALARMVAFP